MKNQQNKAFSLIELSIVLIIIGLLIAGIVGGKSLINTAGLNSARALTNSSPVAGMEDLRLWIETTSKKSFDQLQPDDGSTVVEWKDINPQSNNKVALTTGSTPTYLKDAVNGLPGIQFDGTDYFEFDGAFLVSDQATIFAVVGDKNRTYIYGVGNTGANPAYQYLRWDAFASYFQYTIAATAYTQHSDASNSPHIITARSNANGVLREYYVDGVFAGSNNTGSLATAVSPYYYIGRQFNWYSAGGILSEVIMFDRALSDFEREEVEKYLSKKWKIKLNS